MKRPTGDSLPPGSVGSRQVRSNPSTKHAVPPIQVRRWVRNGTHPNAEHETLKHESLNHAALYRTKDLFMFPGLVSAASTQPKWRAAFRTSPYAHAIYVSAVLTYPAAGSRDQNTYSRLRLFTAADESVTHSDTQFNYGPGAYPGAVPPSTSTWEYVRTFDKMIEVSPSTDYYAFVENMNGARIVSIVAFELTSMTENFDGYLAQNIAASEPITDIYRQNQSELLQETWAGYDPKAFTWSTDPGGTGRSSGYGPGPNFDYKSITSTTGTNILDTGNFGVASTVVNANTPGFHPDLRNKARLSQSAGVPYVMKAFGWYDQAAVPTPTGGAVELKDSSGAVIATITGWGATPEWRSVAFNLPATHAKYDVHYRTTTALTTFHLWAVSAYPVG
jgi:hypothetical protein